MTRKMARRMKDDMHEQIRQLINRAGKIMVVSHIRPDGDAIGSLLGLGIALQEGGKTVSMVLADGVPASFRQLPGAAQITRKVQGTFDTTIVVDASDLQRIGNAFSGQVIDLNID